MTLTTFRETIIKVSAFSRRGTGAVIEHFRERWGEIFQVAVPGTSGSTLPWRIKAPD